MFDKNINYYVFMSLLKVSMRVKFNTRKYKENDSRKLYSIKIFDK